VWTGAEKPNEQRRERDRRQAKGRRNYSGAVLCGMCGLVLSFEVKVGDSVNAGDLVAMIEAMKMRRHVNSPRSGVVKENLGPLKVKWSILRMC